jgi:phytoene synthase
VADEDGPLEEKRAALQAWRERVAKLGEGGGDMAVTRVLARATAAFELRPADMLAVIDGMEMDAAAPIVAPDYATLDLYCDRVASAVGRLSVRAFGDASAAADQVAYNLGRALQLTNILRDLGEDAARGRLYLPHEYLVEESVPLAPHAASTSPNLPRACARLARLAERYFEQAEGAMQLCKPSAMRPARLMAASYRPLLEILRRRGFSYEGPRVSLPKWQKFALAARIFLP